MVPPLSIGTLLRQRYLIQAILGQGGFGRTYLAIDQERFDEQCVIKEFSVPYDDEVLVKKSQTLFHREASTLYQIQHPQVPRFWAAFEEAQRLFLVQDFIPGKTYRLLLQERLQHGELFTEVDILFLLKRSLPVLAYLHDRGIIHRDLSPENIILMPTSPTAPIGGSVGLPVIIDFGAVKEATTHWQHTSAITRVGKVGYAPPEQLQTGKVYANSDLYSLAATCLVLLTGQEPRSLVDAETLAWNWHPYAQISPDLGHILQRMLSVHPSDRYDSAQAVEQALYPLLGQIPTAAQVATETMAASVPGAIAVPSLPARPRSSAPHPIPETHLDNHPYLHPKTHPWLRLSMVTAFVLGSAIAGNWLWQRWQASPAGGEVWVSGTKVPRAEASRIIGSPGILSGNTLTPTAPTATDTTTLTQRPVSASANPPQDIQFPSDKISTTISGTVLENSTQSYRLTAAKGQILTATLNGSGVVMSVLRANQEGIDSAAYQTRSWTGNLPADGQYLIQVSGAGQYLLDVALTPTSRPNQDRTDRVSFARGTNGTTVTGTISPQQLRRYLLKAQQGQLVLVKVIEGNVAFSAIAPSGERLGGTTATTKEWKGQLPIAGDYVIEVTAEQPGDFALSFEIF